MAVLGSSELAHELGKKGTSSDVTFYNLVRDGAVLTTVEPTQFPERFPPLLYSVALADRVELVVGELSKAFAETVATLELFDVPVDVALGSGVGEAEVRRALKGTRLADAPLAPLDPARLRETLLALAPERPAGGPVAVRLDHAFPVKGVGTVVLGFVQRGTVQAHDRLRLYPTDREVEVRSIQVQDVDVRSAAAGTRVGLALKGVDADEVARGHVLAPAGSHATGTRLSLSHRRDSAYFRGRLAEGNQVQLLAGLQLVPARIAPDPGASLAVLTDRPVVADPGDPVWLADLAAAPGPRLAARAVLDELKVEMPGAASSAP